MMHGATRSSGYRRLGAILTVLIGVVAIGGPAQAATAATQMRFGTPEAAVDVLRTALKADDESTLRDLLGQEYVGRLLSKDKVAAHAGRQRLSQAIEEGVSLRQDTADRVVLVIGKNA